MNSMKCKFSLLKYKFSYNTNFSIFPKKSFTLKINKFADVSSQVKVAPIKIPSDFYQEEKHGRDNTPPKAGEIYPIPLVESKLLALEQGYLKVWDRDPVSSFYTMKVKGKNYHVFNAARISLGKMCAMIGHVLQGKNSPHYKPYQVDYNDVVVIVNAKFTWLTGKKLEQKLYRHHTGFPGGLKEIKARHYLEKNPAEMVMRSIKGMLPKNKLRKEMLTKVKIYEEGGHDLYKLGLPQFGKMKAIDYNEIFGANQINKDSVIINTTFDDQNLPDEFKEMRRLDKENPLMNETPKTRVNDVMKQKWDKYMRNYRFRQYRNIRNKAYRYI